MTKENDALSQVVVEFFDTLRGIADKYEELTDTDVREALHETLNYHFVWDRSCDKLPIGYRMFSKEADEQVAVVVSTFLQRAKHQAAAAGLDVGQVRLDLLQAPHLESDVFIGYVKRPLPCEPPSEDLFEPGDYDDEG